MKLLLNVSGRNRILSSYALLFVVVGIYSGFFEGNIL